jgi:acetolactate synthase regulatory subunit
MGKESRILKPVKVRDFHVQKLNMAQEDGGTDA